MRYIPVLLVAVMMAMPLSLALAEVQWHNFGGGADTDKIKIGQTIILVASHSDAHSEYPQDDFMLTVRAADSTTNHFLFSSSYGYGAVAVYKNLILLKYGVGRGPATRVDHVKALRLDHGLNELVDVQSSFYVLTSSHNSTPDLFEYRLAARSEGDYTKLSFSLSRPQHGIPSVRIVKLRNDS